MAKKKFIPRPKESEKVIKNRWSKKRESIETLSNNIQRLRYNVSVDLKSDNEKIFLTALVVAMMLKTGERVGNELSASNGHVGITGLKKEQVNIIGNKIILEYVGKSGVEHDKSFSDEKIAKALKIAKKKSKNDSIFVTSKGFKIKNNRINRYLSDFEITTKDIRGFSSNSWVIKKLKEIEPEETESKRNRQFNSIVKKIALKVGHGSATLKKHYLVPELQPNFVEFGKVIEVDDLVKYNEGGVIDSGEKTKKIEIKEQEPIVEKTENVIDEEVESTHERFELDETKSIDDVYSNIDKIAVQYANRKMAAIQVESYLNEVDKSLSKEFVTKNEINNRDGLFDFVSKRQVILRKGKGKERSEVLKEIKNDKTQSHTDAIVKMALEQEGAMQKLIQQEEEKERGIVIKLKSTMSKGGSLTVKNKQVYGDDKPLRDFSLDEAKPFMSVWHEEKGNWFYAKDTFYIWFYDEKDSGAKISSGEFDFLLFPPPIKYQSLRLGYGVVDSIWRAQYQNKYKGAKHLLGMVEGWYDENNNTVIVKYMSVKPSAKRNRINSFMIMYAKQVFGVENVEFNEPSDEGTAFSEAKTHEDFKPKISVSYNDNNELLAKAKTLGHNITGIYQKAFKGHEELFLFEIAQQANTDEVSKDGAIKVAGNELVEIALLLYPNVKIGDKFFSVASDSGKKFRSGGSLPMHYIKVTTKDGDYIGAIKFNPNNQERVNNLADLASTAKLAGYKLTPIDIETYRELIKKIDYDKLQKYQEDMVLANNTSSGLHDKSFENGGEMEEYYGDMEENHDMFEEHEYDYMVDHLIKNKDQYQDKFQNDKRFILSHEKEILFREREYPEGLSHKPNGIWYSFGMEWINDVGNFAPSLASTYKFVHEIKVTDKILILNTIEEAIEFTEKYGSVYNPSSIMNYYYIDWKKVAEDYSGIEVMNPYFWSREWTSTIVKDGVEKKYNTHELLFWLRSWDSASGCIWKKDGIESIENVFSYENGNELTNDHLKKGGDLRSEYLNYLIEKNLKTDIAQHELATYLGSKKLSMMSYIPDEIRKESKYKELKNNFDVSFSESKKVPLFKYPKNRDRMFERLERDKYNNYLKEYLK